MMPTNTDGYPDGCGAKIGEHDNGDGTESQPVTCGLRAWGGVALCAACLEGGPAIFVPSPPWDGPAELAKMESKRDEHRRKAIAALTDGNWMEAENETRRAWDCDVMTRAIRQKMGATPPPPFATERFGLQHIGMEVMTAWSSQRPVIARVSDDRVALRWPLGGLTWHRFDEGIALVNGEG